MRLFYLFTLFIFTSLSLSLKSQALLAGNVEINAGLGFGIYGVSNNDYDENSDVGVPGLISFGVAYQISNSFAIGLNIERNGFITDPDSNHKAVSNNLGLLLQYNALNTEKNVIALGLEIGGSKFRYDDFKDEEYVESNGSQIKFGVAWKHFFSNHLGMHVNLRMAAYSYSDFVDGDGDKLKVYKTNAFGFTVEERDYEISMAGMNFGFGLVYKI